MNEALALEIFKSQMVIVVEGLKIMAYANGGAVVALLALLGSLAGRCTTVPHVTRAILCFVAGLVTSIMSFFLSYFTQMIVVKGFFDDFCDWIPHHRLLFSFTVNPNIGILLKSALDCENKARGKSR